MAFDLLKTRCWRLWKRLNTKVRNTVCVPADSWICHSLWSLSSRSAYKRPRSHKSLFQSLTLAVLTPNMKEKPGKPFPFTYKEKCYTYKKVNAQLCCLCSAPLPCSLKNSLSSSPDTYLTLFFSHLNILLHHPKVSEEQTVYCCLVCFLGDPFQPYYFSLSWGHSVSGNNSSSWTLLFQESFSIYLDNRQPRPGNAFCRWQKSVGRWWRAHSFDYKMHLFHRWELNGLGRPANKNF